MKNKKEYDFNKKIKLLDNLRAFNLPSIGLGLCGIGVATILSKINPSNLTFAKDIMNLSIFMESVAIPYSITTTLITKRYIKNNMIKNKYSVNIFNEANEIENKFEEEISKDYVLTNNKVIDEPIKANTTSLNNNYIEEVPMHKVKQLKR